MTIGLIDRTNTARAPSAHISTLLRRGAVLGLTAGLAIACCAVPRPAAAADATRLAVGGTGKPEKTELNFGYAQTADHAPLVLGVKEGFFKAEGLTLNIRPVSAVNTVTSIVSGDLDIDNITWIQYLTVARQGIDLRVVAEASRSSPGFADYVVKKDSPLKKPEDLLGKKVGIVSANGVCDFLLDDLLKSKGLDFHSIGYATIPIPNLASTVLSGGVDSSCVPEPFLTPALEQGDLRPLLDLFSGQHADWPITTYGVTAAFASKYPNTIGALQRALAKSRKFANEHPAELRAILATYTSISADLAKKMVLPKYPLQTDVAGGLGRTEALLKRINFLQS